MKYISIPVTPFEQNCSIAWCDATKESVFIDPGGDADELIRACDSRGLKPVAIYLTHGHLDHVGGTTELVDHYQIPVWGPHKDDAYWLEALHKQAQMFGLPECQQFVPDHWLDNGDQLVFGKQEMEVVHTPGHTPGHLVLFHRESAVVFSGDLLFRGSIGRSDFPGGDHQQLIDSIKNRLFPLGDDVRVVPGHGPETTIGEEKRTNPFVR